MGGGEDEGLLFIYRENNYLRFTQIDLSGLEVGPIKRECSHLDLLSSNIVSTVAPKLFVGEGRFTFRRISFLKQHWLADFKSAEAREVLFLTEICSSM